MKNPQDMEKQMGMMQENMLKINGCEESAGVRAAHASAPTSIAPAYASHEGQRNDGQGMMEE